MELIFWIILIVFLFFRLTGQQGRKRYPSPPPRDEHQDYGDASRYRDDLPLPGPWDGRVGDDPLPGPWSTRDNEYEQVTRDKAEDSRDLPVQAREPAGYPGPAEDRSRRRLPGVTGEQGTYAIKAAPHRAVPEEVREETHTGRRQQGEGQPVESLRRLMSHPDGIVAGVIFSEVLQRRGGRAGLRPPGQR